MPFFLLVLLGAGVAFAVTAILTPAVRDLALRRQWTDTPDGLRKLHTTTTPSVGGIAIFFGVAVALMTVTTVAPLVGLHIDALHPVVYLGAVLVVIVGFVDDVRGLGFKTKFAVEILLAWALLQAGYRIDLSTLPFVGSDVFTGALWSIPLTALWIVGVMNAVNLIDGVDGLASGVAAIAFASMALAFGLRGDISAVLVATLLVGSLIGFLLYNFNPASIFMGDSGSLFLGYALAVYSLSSPGNSDPSLAPLVPVLALGLPLLDTSLSVARRVAGGKAMFAPDRDHIHHRMADRMSTRRAVFSLYLVAAGFGLLAVLASSSGLGGVAGAVAGAGALAAGLLLRLGYIRLPYQRPMMVALPADRITERATEGPAAPSSTYGPASGDGSGLDHLPAPSGDGSSTPELSRLSVGSS